ncbi:HNH/ENDO VII family nuclease [Streptomyces xanthochromogenes]|uniref:HNH/ENDO VII family nuclease n=1 Tax=Streptomyces xanthochromogenes TaxID=67384 RepID=UPI003800CA5A
MAIRGAPPAPTATAGHPFWLEDPKAWTPAGDIQPGSLLRTASGTWVKVTAAQAWSEEQKVFNLSVNGIHTYFIQAGTATALVHNSSACKFWKQSSFEGQRVYKRDDLLDLDYVSPAEPKGRSNRQLMKGGLVPFGRDDKRINLHHMLQTQDGPIAEVSGSMHSGNSHQLHWKSGTDIPSGIDRPAFNKWRKKYWRARLKELGG